MVVSSRQGRLVLAEFAEPALLSVLCPPGSKRDLHNTSCLPSSEGRHRLLVHMDLAAN